MSDGSRTTLDNGSTRVFETGALRDTATNKLDYEGFFEPLTFDSFAKYLNKHRKMADGSLRDSDNWQKGIPMTVYMKSAFRHFVHMWKIHRGYKAFDEKGNQVSMEDSINGLIFNARGYLYEMLKSGVSMGSSTSPRAEATQAETPVSSSSHSDSIAALGAPEVTSWGLLG
jgi:hypothetical protein